MNLSQSMWLNLYPMERSDEHMMARLTEEIALMEKSKARCQAIARRSFVKWTDKTMIDICKELGLKIIRLPQKLVKAMYRSIFD